MSKAKLVEKSESDEELFAYLNNYCCMFDVTLKDLTPKVDFDHPISASKLIQSLGVTKDNGRVI